ncbi:MAG: hypothetical protein GX862_04920 [Leucobacter sp.]|nr:hypothetical protein [Leucobacter sp.]
MGVRFTDSTDKHGIPSEEELYEAMHYDKRPPWRRDYLSVKPDTVRRAAAAAAETERLLMQTQARRRARHLW